MSWYLAFGAVLAEQEAKSWYLTFGAAVWRQQRQGEVEVHWWPSGRCITSDKESMGVQQSKRGARAHGRKASSSSSTSHGLRRCCQALMVEVNTEGNGAPELDPARNGQRWRRPAGSGRGRRRTTLPRLKTNGQRRSTPGGSRAWGRQARGRALGMAGDEGVANCRGGRRLGAPQSEDEAGARGVAEAMDKAAGRRRMLNDVGEGIQRSSGSRREGQAGRRRSGHGHRGLDGGSTLR